MTSELFQIYLLLTLCSSTVSFECDEFTARFERHTTETSHHFSSPNFPFTRSAGDYICNYFLNPKKYSVRIVFSDFYLYGASVHTDCLQGDGDFLKIFIGDIEEGTYCAASKLRPPPITATGQSVTLHYVVRSNDTRTTRPGFQAAYVFTRNPHWLEKPLVLTEYILTNGDGHTEMTLSGPGLFDVMLLIQSSNLVYFTMNSTNNISFKSVTQPRMVLYDGPSSMSLVVMPNDKLNYVFTSSDTTLMFTLHLELSIDETVEVQFVYAFCTHSISVGGLCPNNYFPCEDNSHCIPEKLLCDSYNHCPDNSDEVFCNVPCLKCRNGGSCDQDIGICECVSNFYGNQCHFYACGDVNCNHGYCEITDMKGDYHCVCHMGFSGQHCDIKQAIESCTGTCEKENRCQVYRSSSMGLICECNYGYFGDNCEFNEYPSIVYYDLEQSEVDFSEADSKEVDAPNPGHTHRRAISKMWIILMTSFGIFFLILFCCCVAKRGSARGSRSTTENCRSHRTRTSQNGNAPPEPYHQNPALIRSSSSLFAIVAAWRRATMRPQTPPPSYNTIEPPMYTTVATEIPMDPSNNTVYTCTGMRDQRDAVITRESSGLPDIVTEQRPNLSQSIVSQL